MGVLTPLVMVEVDDLEYLESGNISLCINLRIFNVSIRGGILMGG